MGQRDESPEAGLRPRQVSAADSVGMLASDQPLFSRYDVALLDLDGVVYQQEEPVPAASPALAAVREKGMKLAFVTNNASRRPAQVVELLEKVGVGAVEDEVVTSAQASARMLAERLPAGAPVLVVGTEALAAEIELVGLSPLWTADGVPAAVVQGYGRHVGWAELSEAVLAVNRGAYWVATNPDLTIPSARGPLPGNGALLAAVAAATNRRPDVVVGKPHPRLHAESVARSGARRPLVVGDRLDTDIEGANNAGTDSLLVLTGVTTAAELLAAEPAHRPSYVSDDLRGLLEPAPSVRLDGSVVNCGDWVVRRNGKLELATAAGKTPATTDDRPPMDALRALATAAWEWPGESGVTASDATAETALSQLNLLS